MPGCGLDHWRLVRGWTQRDELRPAAVSGAPGPVPSASHFISVAAAGAAQCELRVADRPGMVHSAKQ